MSEERQGFSSLCQWHDKQKVACRTANSHTYTLYGGSRGPGKSYWLRWYGIRRLIEWGQAGHEGVRIALFCEDYPTLTDRQITKIETEFPPSLGTLKQSREHGLGFHLTDDLGAGVLCLRNLDKPKKYQSAEFAGVLVDELTQNQKSTFDILRGSMRWPGIQDVFFAGATNPGGVGHLWVKDLWVSRVYPPELEPLADQFAFVPALPDDNPHLDPAYWEMLETLPPDLARAWRWGDWDVFEGQVFSEWRKHLHVIEPEVVPEHWVRWRSVDWGYAAPMCCLWLARDPDTRRVWVYRELYQDGLTDPEQAEKIRQMTPGDERINLTLADPSMWTRKTMERETTTSADVYLKYGVRLTKGDNDRLIGKRRVHDGLAVMGDELPGLQVFQGCHNLIRTLPALPYDDVRVEDVDTGAEDHAYDCLRYGLSYKVHGSRRQQPAVKDMWRAARR